MSDRAAHAAQLRDVKQKRLDILEIQAGEQGSTTPPHVLTEIDQLRIDLAQLSVADAPVASEDVRKLLRRYDAVDLLTQTLAGALARLTAVEQAFADFRADRGKQIVKDEAERGKWRLATNAWLILISAGVFYLIIHSL